MKQNRDTQIGERARATVAARAAADAAKRARKNRTMSSDSSTGGSDTVPATSDRADFLKELAKRNATPGMAKGGKTASCGLKNGGKAKSFAATKFGAAMMKKSADTKGRAMVKKADGGKGYAKGGKVKKMAVGGMAPNTAGGTVTGATPGNTQTGVPSAPAANTAARVTTPSPAANTAAPAANTAPPAANTAARVTGIDPVAAAKYAATRQGIEQARVAAAQKALTDKYSSATPNRDKSNTNTYTKDAAGNVIGVQTTKNFDRNQSFRDFNSVARNYLNQGVPKQAIIQAQGELRKLQMDVNSTPRQHQDAINAIMARMKGLVPGAAKGGSMKAAKKFASGGLVGGHKAANGIAKKGLTKGKQVKMSKGGACYAKGGSVRGIDGIATKGKTRCKGARK
jgi:hypothetical protein